MRGWGIFMHRGDIDCTLPTEALVAMLPLISVSQAAALGSTSARTLRRMCQSGQLKAGKVDAHWRIARDPFLRQFGLVDG